VLRPPRSSTSRRSWASPTASGIAPSPCQSWLGVDPLALQRVLAAGPKPHPSELEIRLVADLDWRDEDDKSPAHGVIGAYPSDEGSEDNEDLE
jgi:hypothetical protein